MDLNERLFSPCGDHPYFRSGNIFSADFSSGNLNASPSPKIFQTSPLTTSSINFLTSSAIYKPNGIYTSTSTLQKRVKPVLDTGDYQRKLPEDAKPTHAVLVYRNRTFYLHIAIERQVPKPKGNNPAGVDTGMRNLLVASNYFKIKVGVLSVAELNIIEA